MSTEDDIRQHLIPLFDLEKKYTGDELLLMTEGLVLTLSKVFRDHREIFMPMDENRITPADKVQSTKSVISALKQCKKQIHDSRKHTDKLMMLFIESQVGTISRGEMDIDMELKNKYMSAEKHKAFSLYGAINDYIDVAEMVLAGQKEVTGQGRRFNRGVAPNRLLIQKLSRYWNKYAHDKGVLAVNETGSRFTKYIWNSFDIVAGFEQPSVPTINKYIKEMDLDRS